MTDHRDHFASRFVGEIGFSVDDIDPEAVREILLGDDPEPKKERAPVRPRLRPDLFGAARGLR